MISTAHVANRQSLNLSIDCPDNNHDALALIETIVDVIKQFNAEHTPQNIGGLEIELMHTSNTTTTFTTLPF